MGLLVAQPSFANDAESFIKNLSGCFRVSFDYVEDGEHNQFIDSLYEWVGQKPGTSEFALQHIGVVEGKAFKHWREEWKENEDQTWKQTVIGPFEDFRYECSAPIEKNQWRCTAKGAPKPRRDKDRKDYVKLDRENTIQSTSKAVVQAENNIKRDKNGNAVTNEIGWNKYLKVDESFCKPALELLKGNEN
jgi:hypothetical protein